MKKILVVDDSMLVIKILKSRLEAIGYMVIYAQDGIEAIEKIQEESPSLIILDLMLPKLGGIEVMRKLKSDEYESVNVPIIAMSANNSMLQKKKATNVGAKFFIRKPIDLDELEEKIDQLM